MNCPNCGKLIPGNALICPECGAMITADGTLGATPTGSRVEEPLNFAVASDGNDSASAITVDSPGQAMTTRPWFKILCVAVVVILCVVIIVAVSSRSRSSETETVQAATPSPSATATTLSPEEQAQQAIQAKVMSDVKNAANAINNVKTGNGGTLAGVTTTPCSGTADSPGVGSIETETTSAAYTCSSGVTVSITIEPAGGSYVVTASYAEDGTTYTYDSNQGEITPSSIQ